MAVVSVKELHQRRRSSNEEGKVRHTRAWLVTTDDINDGTAVALAANDGIERIPFPKELWPGTLNVRVTRIDVQPRQDSGVHFEVTVDWNTVDADQDNSDLHPLDRPPVVNFNALESNENYFIDETPDAPKAVVNTAGDAFESYLTRERGMLEIVMTRNEASWDAAEADLYANTCNIETVIIDGTTYPPGTLKLSPIVAARVVEVITIDGVEQEVTYYQVTYRFKARKEGWRDYVLDTGFNEMIVKIENVGGEPTPVKYVVPIVSKVGTRVTQPYPLNGAGRKKPNPDDKPAELEFLPYVERSWSALYFN